MTPAPLIHLHGLKKVFLTDEIETHALAGIYLEILPGEYVAIAGPSGCGKSTLLSILGLLDSPTEGTYLLNGKQVEELNAGELARIRNRESGFIFQGFNLIDDLTVYENVEQPLTYRREKPRPEPKRRVLDSLHRVRLIHPYRHEILAVGQQRRRVNPACSDEAAGVVKCKGGRVSNWRNEQECGCGRGEEDKSCAQQETPGMAGEIQYFHKL